MSVSASKVYKNDAVQVEYKVANAGETRDFVTPNFMGWNVLAGPSYSQEESIYNGQSQRSTSFIFTLMPAQQGKLAVPGTSVVADGKSFSCKAVYVNVLNQNNPSPQQQANPGLPPFQSLFGEEDAAQDAFMRDPVLKHNEKPDQKIRDNVFVKAAVSKNSCYAGEPILVVYKLYTAMKIQPKVNRQPAFTGCSVTEMTTDEGLPAEKIGNKIYQVYLIRKVQLVPLQPGPLTLDTASVTSDVNFVVADQQNTLQSFTATLGSKPVTLQVKPLPDKNKPADFSGIVGHFGIQAQVQKPTLPAGENNTLEISIEGRGNINDVPLPAIQWPAGVDHFEPVQHDNVDKLNFPVHGIKTYDIPFVGTKEGAVTIPPATFNFFDPEKETYEVVHTDSIALQFSKAVKQSLKNNPAIISEDFTTRHYIWIVPAIAAVVLLSWWVLTLRDKKRATQKQLAVAQALAPAATPATTAAATATPPAVVPPPASMPVVLPKTDFATAIDMLVQINDNQLFFTKAKQLLTQAIQQTLGVTDAHPEHLLPRLRQTNVGEAIALQCHTLYAQCDLALYAPALGEGNREQVLASLRSIIQQLQAWKA